MTPERWQSVKELFQEVLEVPPEERPALLSARSAGDAELAREVAALLESHGTDHALDAGVLGYDPDGAGDEAEREEPTGFRIGPYRVREPIGRGGMGIVYLAVRDDDAYERAVAVKLIKRGMDADDIVRRFRNERQILARLDHPGIAKLLDGGTTIDGRPYLVMELVRGEPITRHCDKRGLGVEERLHLFRRVCGAVQYAHQNLVVHRDIKPANILVTGEGHPKLLDFGIAKILDPAEGADAATMTAARMLTPEYASPEQVKGRPVTTATDVYSLGVLLYELLTGQRPYRFPTQGREEIARAVCEQEPVRPSTAAGRPGGSGPQIARRLTGDLDKIALTALQKEPGRRYATVGELAEDVRNHQESKPVRAREPSLAYRAGRFVRRHPLEVGLSGALVVALVAFSIVTALQGARAASERDRAEAALKFLTGIFTLSDPGEARGRTITAREILDQGSRRIEDLADRPILQASLMATIGTVYLNLGLPEEARRHLERSLALRRALLGERHLDVADSLARLAALDSQRGAFDVADERVREALAIRRTLLGRRHPDVAATLDQIGDNLRAKGDLESAEGLLREALALHRSNEGDESLAVATTLNNLGLVLWDRGRYADAEPMLREALEVNRRVKGGDHPDVANSLNSLGALLHGAGRYAESENALRESLRVWRRIHQGPHPTVVHVLSNLGMVIQDQGRFAEAEPLLREALDLRRGLLGEEHPEVAKSLSNLGGLLHLEGRSAEAEPLLRKSVELYGRLGLGGHLYASSPLLHLGKVLVAAGRPRAAERVLREALRIRSEQLARGDWRIAAVESALGGCLVSQRRVEEARPLLERSLVALRESRGPDNPLTREAAASLDSLRRAAGTSP